MADVHPLIPMLPPGTLPDHRQILHAIVGLLAVLGPLALVRVRQLRVGRRFEANLKVSHFLPAIVQCVIFAYWSLYYRRLEYYVPLIGLELVFAYLLDALVSLSQRGRWRVSAGPLPIVFSTNLFVLFLPGQVHLTLGAIALAVLSKAVLVRDGRHMMNPSAFGIATVGLLTLMFPAIGYGDTAREFNLPPNMAELVLLLGLIVQLRVPVVLASCGCVFALHVWEQLAGAMIFSPLWAPVTLVIILLVTDPATVPRSQLGRLMYGFVAGILMQILAVVTTQTFSQDFYAKVMCIPIANMLVPWIDWLAAKVPTANAKKWLQERFNLLHVGVWLVLMAAPLVAGAKYVEFSETNRGSRLHQRNRTPHLKLREDGGASCRDNPVWCDGFSFAAEARLWLK